MPEDDTITINKKLRLGRWFGMVLIVVGIGCGAAAIVLNNRQLKPPPVTSSNNSVTDESSPVASDKPTTEEVAKYDVAPDLPKFITIPAIKVSQVRILQLGLNAENQIATPSNVFDAGWYKASAKPGQDGAMFIYGHVSSWEANGAFHDLKKLKLGDTVKITRGDNAELTYKVIDMQIYPADDVPMDTVLAPVNNVAQGLNLMTCAGKVIEGTNDFTDRLVVYTSLVES
jgi:sortase A